MFVTNSRNKKKKQKSTQAVSTLALQNFCGYSHGKKLGLSQGTILMGTIYIFFCVYCIGLNFLSLNSAVALNFLMAAYTTRSWISLWQTDSNQKHDLWDNAIQIMRFRRLRKCPVFAITQQLQSNKSLLVWTTVSLIGLFVAGHNIFDPTSGFPGEGPANSWSATYPSNLTMATWNTRSLTKERFEYCQNLGYDILAITELWKTDKKFANGSVSFTHSKSGINPATGDPMFPNDPATGVGILLSDRATQKYMMHGSPCRRITWVRLKGPTCNIFAIAVYMPHRARVAPAQSDTMKALIDVLKKVPKNDCIVLLGDFNEQLPANVTNRTGKWAFGKKSDNAEDLLEVMQMFDLFAVNTKFQPKHKVSNATYTACVEGTFAPKSEAMTGREVRAKYRGKFFKGKIIGAKRSKGVKLWKVEFEDNYNKFCSERQISKWLVPPKRTYKQIDYIIVSNRFLSSVISCRTHWAPSSHSQEPMERQRGPRTCSLLMEMASQMSRCSRKTRLWSADQ